MPGVINGEALAKEEQYAYEFPIEKDSKSNWIDAGQVEPVFSPLIPQKENFVNASWAAKEKIFVISKSAYDIDGEYRSASKSLFYLTFFSNYSYRIKKPLPIIIERGINPNIFLVGSEELNKYGIGFSKEESLKDFEDFIIDDYKSLKESTPDELSDDAKELLNLYKSYIDL